MLIGTLTPLLNQLMVGVSTSMLSLLEKGGVVTAPASGFGPHLMIDAWGCPEDKLADLDRVFDFMDKLPEQIGMTKISAPHVFKYAGLIPQDWGITGNVIIAESHITVHTFAEKGYVFFDAFSCKPFDTERVLHLFQEAFGATRGSMQVATELRGQHFPRS